MRDCISSGVVPRATMPLSVACSLASGRFKTAASAPLGAREPQNFDQIPAISRKELRRNLAALTFFVAF